MNQAMARILRANAHLRRQGLDASVSKEVLSEYLRAAKLLPNAASPVNHLAFVLLQRHAAGSGSVPELRDLETRLIHVIKAQGDLLAVRNLKALYLLAGPNRDDIARQLRLLKDLESQLARLPE